MTEKDKIVEIILNTDVTERAAARIADDLIENGIGDVTEWKRMAEVVMKDFVCKKCKNTTYLIQEKSNGTGVATGLYCAKCGTWHKWLNKQERVLYETEVKKDNSRCVIIDDSRDVVETKELHELKRLIEENNTKLKTRLVENSSGIKINLIKYGWICPVCGAVMSPEQTTCVVCTPHRGENHGITDVYTNGGAK